jgi:hypothetical protein
MSRVSAWLRTCAIDLRHDLRHDRPLPRPPACAMKFVPVTLVGRAASRQHAIDAHVDDATVL